MIKLLPPGTARYALFGVALGLLVSYTTSRPLADDRGQVRIVDYSGSQSDTDDSQPIPPRSSSPYDTMPIQELEDFYPALPPLQESAAPPMETRTIKRIVAGLAAANVAMWSTAVTLDARGSDDVGVEAVHASPSEEADPSSSKVEEPTTYGAEDLAPQDAPVSVPEDPATTPAPAPTYPSPAPWPGQGGGDPEPPPPEPDPPVDQDPVPEDPTPDPTPPPESEPDDDPPDKNNGREDENGRESPVPPTENPGNGRGPLPTAEIDVIAS